MKYDDYRKQIEKYNKDVDTTSDAQVKLFINPFLRDSTLKQMLGLKLISSGILDPKLKNYFNNMAV